MRRFSRVLFLLAAAVLLPSAAHAQASIAGVVKDATGAVLPGVTVAASSPVLIEKARTAVSDGTGHYRIVDLRAGTYSVTFTLTGFSTLKQEGIELTGLFTATVNADMQVGRVEETITVTTATPIVDVQSARRQTTVNGEVLTALPSARGYSAIMLTIPGITVQGGTPVDVQVTPGLILFGGGGGRANEGRLQVDGLNTGAAINGAGTSGYNVDVTNSQEVSIITSGALGEAEVGGPTLNFVPKTGGNTFRGSFYAAGFNDRMVSSNYSQTLKDAGLAVPPTILKLWDYNAGAGGPIKKDRIWFFANYRDEGSYNTISGLFANANFNAITAPVPDSAAPWLYVPDTTTQTRSANSYTIGNARMTVQATPRNKFNLFWDEQHPCTGATWTPTGEGCRHSTSTEVYGSAAVGGIPSTISPEAGGYGHRFQRVQQATWTSPVTNRLLLEAGVGTVLARWGTNRRPDSVTQDLVRVTEGCNTVLGCLANGGIVGLTYRSEAPTDNWMGAHTWRASASFISGAHQMKVGYQGAYHVDDQKSFPNSTSTAYTFQNGSPANPNSSITETLNPFQIRQRVRYDAFYAQEEWTIGRATLQGAVRYDYARSFFPDQQIGPVRFLPTPVVFAQDDPAFATPNAANCGAVPAGFTGTCVNNVTGYHDITPRLGLAYNLFGTGKTSIKVTLGKYLESASSGNGNYTAGNPVARMATNVSRTWLDANRNYVPDCVLENPAAQNTVASGGDSCGVILNQNFGKPVFTNSFDSSLMGEWGVRPSDWSLGVSVQQQILPRTSLEIGYNRRWLQNFTVTDNILQAPSDFTPFSIVAPIDARLPGGGGYTIGNLYNVNPLINGVANTTLINNFTTRASNYGNLYQHSDGVLFNISSRVRDGLTWQGGIGGGKTVSDNCEARANIPELTVGVNGPASGFGPAIGPTAPYCHVETALVWRATALGAYLIPKLDVQISGTFRSDQGGSLAANYNVPSATVQSQGPQPLGRPLSNNAAVATVNLITPGTLYGDRINELDFKVAKILRFHRTRTNVGVELYNVLNSGAVLTYSQVFSPAVQSGPGAWLQPLSILTPRFVRISAQIDF